jgi:hypothetical protein
MRGPIRIAVLTALAVCGFGALAGQASAALLGQPGNTPFQAIYGNPGTNGAATLPVGGGLGRNFGFGENMLFRANTTVGVGKNLAIKLGGVKIEATDSYIGGTLMSNKTGENNPLSFAVQFVDFQNSNAEGLGAAPSYSDTHDRQWISEICAPGATKCRVDPTFEVGAAGPNVKIDDVSFNVNIGGKVLVVQGTVWGTWINSTKEKEAPCIEIKPKPAGAGDETLVATQTFVGGPALGVEAEEVKGTACLISANNDWFSGKEPVITIKNE